jgi:hypothetical protein
MWRAARWGASPPCTWGCGIPVSAAPSPPPASATAPRARETGIFLKRVIPTSGLVLLPKCGHTQNLEEPELFNRFLLDFITRVEAGRWPRRIPESQADALIAAVKT